MNGKCGVWLIGARGGVAATSLVGLAALKKGRTGEAGLVSELPEFRRLGLAAWEDFVVGGHEIRSVRLIDEALKLAIQSRAFDQRLVLECQAELNEIDCRIRPGTVCGVGPTISRFSGPEVPLRETPRKAIARVQRDMAEFVGTTGVDHLIVVNVASTEPPAAIASLPVTWAELEAWLDRPQEPAPAGQFSVCHCRVGSGLVVH